jgi:hypothetical protein
MKLVFGGVVLSTLVFACGGGAKKADEPKVPAKSACATAAEHIAGEFIANRVKHVSEEDRPTLVRILTERCETDHWSDAVVSCMSTATGGDKGTEECAKMFTEEQLKAVEAQLEQTLPDENESDDADTESAPDDPCGGGA